ncbi:MAG: amidase family protein [Bacillota bacterium]
MGFVIPFSVTGNPVITIPIGFSGEGLPIGIQCIGRRYEDIKLLEIAAKLCEITGPLKHPSLKY